ncbi:MAG TPA: bifunctional alpha/beta hydrolase/class I SAM-dependent methyltransferase [Verrucomicrobiae bacterium]|nr:bifunctional alpha/beta hydrolase/class I SAM-dependent methyltransferase [Verrucomicrobiae bacterium]
MKTTEHTFKSFDGTELFYRRWKPKRASGKTLIIFHRGHEHSNRWDETVKTLQLEDVTVFAWDARGHGRSPGERGSAESLAVIIRDAEAFARHLVETHAVKLEETVVLAHSVGAVIAAAWVHDFAPPLRGLILATPAFRVKLYLPMAVPLLRLKQKLCGHGYVKSYVKARMLTHDAGQAATYEADPAIFRQIAVNILLDLHDTSTRLLADAGAIHVPTLMLTAGADWVVRNSAPRLFFERLSSPSKRLENLPGFYHAIFHETGREVVAEKVRRFVEESFERPQPRDSLLRADEGGFTRSEYNRLCNPGNPVFGITRSAMKSVGRVSRGIGLGWQAGFDSGRTLDYVYENKARGCTSIGRMIDRAYLNSIGWRGIRQRKLNLQKTLHETILKANAAGRPIRILDIASGPGRYVLETVRDLPEMRASVVLRDYKTENIDAARRLAAEFGLEGVTAVEGDAFDRKSLAQMDPKSTIGIVSGLFELFPANAPVLEALRGLADAIEPGGHLIYTNQPWHPQLEFIARVLCNREGKPWIMRRRTQAEMDQLVAAAGFRKVGQEIDRWGIFSVSVAERL